MLNPTPGAKIRAKLERIRAHRHKQSPKWFHGLQTVCCECKRQRVDGQWMYLPTAPNARVSHGICPICLKKHLAAARAEIEQLHKIKEQAF